MSTRARTFEARVESREQLSEHLLRLVLGGAGLKGFTSTGVPDEWVALVVPGQYQSRFYTVRAWDEGRLTLDVVVHAEGLVTDWAMADPVGDTVTVTEPRGSFGPPEDARWLLLVGDLTAVPAMARIREARPDLETRTWIESPDDLRGSLTGKDVTWLAPPDEGESDLATVVAGIEWPAGPGYFWMAGESAQMRAIRKHLMHERGLPSAAYDVMGYWRGGQRRQPRAVDPGPIWRAGKAAGKNDEQIWADYDAARDQEQR